MLFFLTLFQGLVFGGFCSYIAGQKDRSKGSWFILGFLFSFIALIALVAIPAIPGTTWREKVHSTHPVSQPRGQPKKCPFCAEYVQEEAVVCRFCQRDLPQSQAAMVVDAGLYQLPADVTPGRQNQLTDSQREKMKELGIRLSPDGLEFIFQKRNFSHLEDAVVLANSKRGHSS